MTLRPIRVAELRALAEHLEQRDCAPSLDGYALVDGLRAAADLLDGRERYVHDDDAARAPSLSRASSVSLAVLLRKVAAEVSPPPPVVSSYRIEFGPTGGHDRVRIWNRGALCGELVVREGDGAAFAELLGGGPMCRDRGRAACALRGVAQDIHHAIELLDDDDRDGAVGILGDAAAYARKEALFIENQILKPKGERST